MSIPSHIVVMGVSGAGKSTVGRLLADSLGVSFKDGDDLHTPENIAKMSSGRGLTDDDRWPWLERVAQWLADNDGGVIGCSSLKRSYRDRLRSTVPDAVFIHVHGDRDLLHSRMGAREGHFMPALMLDGQLLELEPLADDEDGKVFDVAPKPEEVAAQAAAWLRER